jgi:putative glutamine amidotransferase
MPRRPLIGITVDTHNDGKQYESPYAYATAVEKGGGLPVLLPYRVDLSVIPELVDHLQGIVFSGGNDLDPVAYGETYHPKTVPVDPLREKFERALMAEVEKRRTPTLGICMGSQLMNLHRGGSMIQFLPDIERTSPIEHRRLGTDEVRHPITVDKDSTAAKAIGHAEVLGNSSHKQSIKQVGKGLRVIATSPDGVIEGVEDPTFPLWLGVQWHPERLHAEADHLALFKLLVDRANGR